MSTENIDTQAQNQDKKVTFDADQQAKIQQIVDGAVARVARDKDTQITELTSTLNNIKTELASAKEALDKAKTPNQKKEAKEEIEGLQAQLAEVKNVVQQAKDDAERLKREALERTDDAKRARQEVIDYRKQVAISNAATKIGFFDPEDVATGTISQNINWDSAKNSFVVSENGRERLNSAMEPMSIEEYLTEVASKKPYLVRSNQKGGFGSSESSRVDVTTNGRYQLTDIFGPKSDSKKASELMKRDPAEYKRMRVMAKGQGLIA